MKDLQYMQRCLDLAIKGQYGVKQNPMVGCVIVKDNKIVGEGWHEKYGQAHAEVNAYRNSGLVSLNECTVYVSLEPCSHYGKTPPCAKLLTELKPDKVVICNDDPNPKVQGNGVKLLNDQGIRAESGLLAEQGLWLNRKFFNYFSNDKPYITLKYASSANGYIAGHHGKQVQISSDLNKIWVHQLRATHQAIMVGAGTWIKDSPQLNNRYWTGDSPDIIIWDPKGKIDPRSINTPDSKQTRYLLSPIQFDFIDSEGLKTICTHELKLEEILQILHNQNVQSILVEGGTWVLQQFIDAQLYHEIYKVEADKTIEDGVLGPILDRNYSEVLNFQGDRIYHFR